MFSLILSPPKLSIQFSSHLRHMTNFLGAYRSTLSNMAKLNHTKSLFEWMKMTLN